jgi:hypothetical protein
MYAGANNSVVPEPYRYAFRGIIRATDGTPIANFPASMMELDFSACHEPSTRPADQIQADRDSDEQGNVVWSQNLNFGGADPCPVRVLIQNVVFAVLAPHQGLPDEAIDGGVRSPDENGDGRIAMDDLVIFQREFVNAEILRREYWRGDLGPVFDGRTGLDDLCTFQVHFTAH